MLAVARFVIKMVRPNWFVLHHHRMRRNLLLSRRHDACTRKRNSSVAAVKQICLVREKDEGEDSRGAGGSAILCCGTRALKPRANDSTASKATYEFST